MPDNQTDTAASAGGHGEPSPSAAMMAEAARILGVTDTPTTINSRQAAAAVLVTVAGPNSRKVVQVASDIPAGRLARSLGEAVGVTVVARLSVRGGDVIHPAQTLSEVGVRPGSVILVDEPGAPGLAHHTPTSTTGGHQQYWTSPPPARRQPRKISGRTRQQRTGRERVVLAAAAVTVATVAFVLGGALTGRGSSTTSAPAVNRLAAQAVTAWMANRPFAGPRLAGVPADVGRTGGPAPAASVEPAGSSTSDGIVSEQFIVTPATGSPYGLTVVTYHDKVAYPVTVTGVAFTQPEPGSGTTSAVPQTGAIVTPTAQGPAQAWAQATFGPGATSPVAELGFGLAGKTRVLNQWHPTAGPATGAVAMVARIEVPLSTGAPGTASAAARTKTDQSLAGDRRTVSADQARLAKLTAASASARTAASRADRAAQAAVAVSNTDQAKLAADRPTSGSFRNDTARAHAAARAVTAAQKAATTAQVALTAAQHAESAAAVTLAADQRTEQAATSSADRTATRRPVTVESVYDVAFNPVGRPVAWVPADYLTGQT